MKERVRARKNTRDNMIVDGITGTEPPTRADIYMIQYERDRKML